VRGNTFRDNADAGIYVDDSTGNAFWLNTLRDNGVNADGGSQSNSWNSSVGQEYWYNGVKRTNYTGNYWGDYYGMDEDGDGIGDTPYVVDADNVDHSPMVLNRPARSFNLSLRRGWNLASSPLAADPPVNTSAFRDTNVTMAARYNRSTGGFDIYRVGKTPVPFPIEVDQGYFLYCDNDMDWNVRGHAPPGKSVTIYQGWNLIVWTNMTASNSRAVAAGLLNVTMVARYNAILGNYDIYRVGKTPVPFSIVPGEGYFIYAAYADPQTLVMG
jgi:parallel beta-helix repeat protein